MSRLIDTILREKQEPAVFAALKSATVIAADNVADYLESTKQFDLESALALPNIAPPLKDMFIEFRLGKPAGSIGWYLHAYERNGDGYFPSSNTDAQEVEDARWMIRGMYYLGVFARRPQMWCEFFVAPDGKLLRIGGKLPFYIRPTKDSAYLPAWEQEHYGEWMLPTVAALLIALWTLCFMHTRNVSLEDVVPPAKLSKAHEKRGHLPLSVYKVLKISPMGGGRGEDLGGTSAPKSLHIRRGHFKVYTDENPLFGRTTGVFWWSQQLVGRRKNGVVQKDYDVYPE